MVTTHITNGKPTSCEVFESSTATKSAVVVIAYGSDGMIDNAHGNWATMMREYASDLAGKGFTALIPDYFASTGTTAGSIDYNNGGSLIVAANRDTWTAALAGFDMPSSAPKSPYCAGSGARSAAAAIILLRSAKTCPLMRLYR